MSDYIRDIFGLTQERMATWLGANRTTLAASETGRRTPRSINWLASLRLTLAAQGKVPSADAPQVSGPAPPPLPPPPLVPEPLEWRLLECRHQADRLGRQLARMKAKAAQFEARLAALPALRAYTGEVKNPAREAGWLALFEGEAVDGLRDECGVGPQQLLGARLAGLQHEADLLAQALAGRPAAS